MSNQDLLHQTESSKLRHRNVEFIKTSAMRPNVNALGSIMLPSPRFILIYKRDLIYKFAHLQQQQQTNLIIYLFKRKHNIQLIN